MPKPKPHDRRTCAEAFQNALDALDVIGEWSWDAATDQVRADTFVALLFNVDPEQAETGVPLAAYQAAIHADDRERVSNLIRQSAQDGGAYLTEYRVISADGRTRWVLARGRFSCDHAGCPVSGRGILVEITRMRLSEDMTSPTLIDASYTILERAAEHALAAHAEIVQLSDPALKDRADALLLELGRTLARREVETRRKRLN